MTIETVLSGIDRYVVICGDNCEVLPTIPDKGVDHVITDPPYSEHVHSRARCGKMADGREFGTMYQMGFDHIRQCDIEAMADQIERTCSRWALVFSDVESCHLWRGAFVDFDYVRTGAWRKLGGAPQFTGDRPAVGFEAITITHRKGRKRWNGGGHAGVWEHLIVQGPERGEHKTPKPLPLMLELVSLFTDPGDVILDPFAGSGTTGVAALRLGRRAILIEREPKWADLARERCQAEVEGSTLQARRAGQLPMFPGDKC